jgi:hypothetical protein
MSGHDPSAGRKQSAPAQIAGKKPGILVAIGPLSTARLPRRLDARAMPRDRAGLWVVSQFKNVTHGCRRSFQTECVGAGNDGSANDPTATAIASGFRSGSQKTVDPQSEQKWKVTARPLSDERSYVLARPSALTSLRRKKAATP